MTHASLFSGIGGFDLEAQWNNIQNIFQVEIDEFCQKVLKKNFPKVIRYNDIRNFNGTQYYGKINILSGGFPCQPFSVAGKREGTKDERYLWEEMRRVISEIKPQWVVIENVYGLLSIQNGMVFEQVLAQMEIEGYETQTFIVPACGKNAPHRRERIWIVAYNDKFRSNLRQHKRQRIQWTDKTRNETDTSYKYTPNTNGERFERSEYVRQSKRFTQSFETNWYEVATQFCGMDDGIPHRVDRLKSLGNAIVPQIAYEIFRNIKAVSSEVAVSDLRAKTTN